MKHAVSALFLVVGVMFTASTESAAAAPGSRPADPVAIAQVKAGTQTVARAIWWGFDPEDATAALQAAIDSGARKVIIEKMNTPWNVEPLTLASDQELVLEPGAVIQARRGSYKSSGACLLTIMDRKNVTITGPGATLRMWREDYDKPPYSHSEWRHAITIKSCTNVRITGLTIAESGGDGIYLGVSNSGATNTDVEIREVICDRNYRQGISVISADGLLIENTVLRGTAGTPPMAGIDFEPNRPDQRLARCVMRNCLSENNEGDGYTFYTKHLGLNSVPISIRLENCRAVGNRNGFRFASGKADTSDSVPGAVEVVGCSFEGCKGAGISISGKPASICPMKFENCRVVNAAQESLKTSPIQLSGGAENTMNIGGVEFKDCLIVDGKERLPMEYNDMAGGVKLAGVTGALTVERAGTRTVYTLEPKLLDQWFPFQGFKEFAPVPVAGVGWEPISPDARPERGWSCAARLRERGEFLIWARAGEEVALTLRLRAVGKMGSLKMPVSVIMPSGKTIKLPDMTGEGEKRATFKAAETGACRLVCEPGRATVQVAASSHRVCMFTGRGPLHLLGAAGELYFHVPAGVNEFAVRVSGAGEGESVKATVFDAAGKMIGTKDNIMGHQFLCTRPPAAGAEVWKVKLEKPSQSGIEDNYLQLQGIATVLASSPQGLLSVRP